MQSLQLHSTAPALHLMETGHRARLQGSFGLYYNTASSLDKGNKELWNRVDFRGKRLTEISHFLKLSPVRDIKCGYPCLKGRTQIFFVCVCGCPFLNNKSSTKSPVLHNNFCYLYSEMRGLQGR